ncbi:hypothetical protein SAMN05444680_106241 [Variovorax sp. YR216]|nr:hypothetical protein SAMN05444680_106241 [Variovorax sp. YR216]
MEAHTNTRRTRIRAIDLPRDPQARAALLKERRRQARRAKRPDHYTGLGIREANVPRARQAPTRCARNARRRKEFRKVDPDIKDLAPIMVGLMPVPIHLENRNTLICASVGAGKSVAMEAMISSAVKLERQLSATKRF